jgi:hypothetical protein
MTNVRLKISPPWVTFINKVQAIFDCDPGIACNVVWTGEPSIVLSVSNPEKAVAIRKLLPETLDFGNVVLTIGVECGKPLPNIAFPTNKKLFETAFKGNPAFKYCVTPSEDGYWFVNFTYVVFAAKVVQFFNDNLNDAHGAISTLYQDIASEIFREFTPIGGGGVAYCTEIATDLNDGKQLGAPLGEWP